MRRLVLSRKLHQPQAHEQKQFQNLESCTKWNCHNPDCSGTSILQGISQVSGAHRILSINIIFIRDIAKKICGEE
ncbi:hypothetical protein Y1Q_0019260 [Alligator mississippiensis]|uniref:Uncharacterized protein n=1 Tax=Alligator mississippiensis TaxID=8496 RepID=A0A151MQR2_ALLMI|nr:hypothetical protein Y1Q_0019260 [Alligator mississippiensis]